MIEKIILHLSINLGLCTEGICGSKSIRLAYSWKELTVFAFFYFVFEGNFPSTSPRGAYFRRGDFTEGFLCYEFGGAYTWRGLFSEFYGSLSMGFKLISYPDLPRPRESVKTE